MTYLLDTNACIATLNGKSSKLADRLAAANPADILLSSIVRAELVFGARKSTRVEENLALLAKFFAPLRSVSFDERCADYYGMLRADLERTGTPIGPNDMLIAATARAHDAVLVTRNTREFRRIVGLRVENWEDDAFDSVP